MACTNTLKQPVGCYVAFATYNLMARLDDLAPRTLDADFLGEYEAAVTRAGKAAFEYINADHGACPDLLEHMLRHYGFSYVTTGPQRIDVCEKVLSNIAEDDVVTLEILNAYFCRNRSTMTDYVAGGAAKATLKELRDINARVLGPLLPKNEEAALFFAGVAIDKLAEVEAEIVYAWRT